MDNNENELELPQDEMPGGNPPPPPRPPRGERPQPPMFGEERPQPPMFGGERPQPPMFGEERPEPPMHGGERPQPPMHGGERPGFPRREGRFSCHGHHRPHDRRPAEGFVTLRDLLLMGLFICSLLRLIIDIAAYFSKDN